MPKPAVAATGAALTLDPSAPTPLYRQVYDGLRTAILDGRLAAGTRLPATRTLASELGISRNTVMNAFDQLLAEGYLEGRVGDGTYVTRALPDALSRVQEKPVQTPATRAARSLSQRGAALAATTVSATREYRGNSAFQPGVPAIDAFPLEVWATLATRRWRRAPRDLLGYGDPAGYLPLREAIAAYVGAARGVRCSPEQVIIVAGSQQGLDLAARLLLDPGDTVWVEDPGYMGARGALRAAGAQIVPVPLDNEGLDITTGVMRNPTARLVYVTPSHQYPGGVTMSLARRLALLEWANRANAWVLEDDYDSEYRYAGRPLAALQGLDRAGRVIYIGTFSKVLSPALRLGYLVAPSDLVDAFVSVRALVDRHSPTLDQVILADFIAEGHLARHIRRTRALYGERQAALVDAAQRTLAGLLEVAPAMAGMHLVGWFPSGVDDQAASQLAAAHGIAAPPLSAYGVESATRGGVLLGYAAFSKAEIYEGVQTLAKAWAGLTLRV